jgi:hypothetical protein
MLTAITISVATMAMSCLVDSAMAQCGAIVLEQNFNQYVFHLPSTTVQWPQSDARSLWHGPSGRCVSLLHAQNYVAQDSAKVFTAVGELQEGRNFNEVRVSKPS